MTHFPSLSYTLTSEIPTLYTHIPEAGKGTPFGRIPPRPSLIFIFSLFSVYYLLNNLQTYQYYEIQTAKNSFVQNKIGTLSREVKFSSY